MGTDQEIHFKRKRTYTATGLKANTAYKFRIRAYKTIGNVNEYSAYSAVVTARTQK